jgi:leucyl/phenylalanyl-tRNA---protein transferase
MAETRDDPDVFWVDPRRRGIFPLDGFRVSRSLASAGCAAMAAARDHQHRISPMSWHGCADRDETWINAEIRRLYLDLHRMGHAHSLEVWEGDTLIRRRLRRHPWVQRSLGKVCSRASTDASKIALAYLVDRLTSWAVSACLTRSS